MQGGRFFTGFIQTVQGPRRHHLPRPHFGPPLPFSRHLSHADTSQVPTVIPEPSGLAELPALHFLAERRDQSYLICTHIHLLFSLFNWKIILLTFPFRCCSVVFN
jgi:hypothetical protein